MKAYEVEMIQGVLISSTALMGICGVFITSQKYLVGKTKTRLLLDSSISFGILTIIFSLVWFLENLEIWLLVVTILFITQSTIFAATFFRIH